MGNFENLLKSAKNYLNSGKFSEAIGIYQRAFKEANAEEKARIKRDLAFCFLRSGDLGLALKEAREAGESFSRLGDDIELARAHLLLTRILLEMGESEEARDLSMKVYESYKPTADHKILGLSQKFLGRAFVQIGDYGQAEDFLQESLSIFRLTNDEGELLNSYNDLAFWGSATGFSSVR